MRKFLQEFQAFISRGNVLDLAVAVITGAAFTNIVNSLIKDVVNPILGVLVGRPDFTNLFFVMKDPPAGFDGPWTYEALTKAGATVLGYGAFLTAVVQFLLMAFTIFWMIKVVTVLRVKIESETKETLAKLAGDKAKADEKAKAEEAAKKAAEEAKALEEKKAAEDAAAAEAARAAEATALLREIRDLLAAAKK